MFERTCEEYRKIRSYEDLEKDMDSENWTCLCKYQPSKQSKVRTTFKLLKYDQVLIESKRLEKFRI